MVAPKHNEWGSDYWLAHFLEGKQTILKPVTDDKIIEFPTGLMVIKGEYLTLAAQPKRKGGYVYQDYRPGAIVCIPLHQPSSCYKHQAAYTWSQK